MAEVAASADPDRRRIDVLGLPVDDLSRDDAIRAIQDHLRDPGRRFMHVVTLNPEYVMAARAQLDFADAIRRAELIVCDGVGVLLAAGAMGSAKRLERMTGVELTDIVTALSAFHDKGGVFLLGGRDAGEAAAGLMRRYPAGRIAGWWSGGRPDSAWDAATLEVIEACNATVVVVGYGAPSQVLWIERNRERLTAAGVRLAIGVGGTIDYLSGHAEQAPGVVRQAGLEWLYRLVREPWRWRRQSVLPRFALLALKGAVEARRPYRILAAMNLRNRQRDSNL